MEVLRSPRARLGMESSVLHFNRFPSIASAVARRMGGSATGPYVNDFTTVDFMAACRSGQSFTNTVVQTIGGHLGPDKHKPTREQQVMLGARVRMDTVLVDGMILFEPREETIHKIVEMAKSFLARKTCVHASRGSQALRNRELGGRQHVGQSRAPGVASLEDQAIPEGGHIQPGRAAPDGPAVPDRGPPSLRTAHHAHHGPNTPADRRLLRCVLAPVGDAREGSEGRRTTAPRVDHLPAWSGPPGLLHGVGP